MQLHPEAVSEFRFIPPCSPIRSKEVPAGDGWLHEVKFDGYRVQAHKVGPRVIIYSRNGHDFTKRFPSIAQLLHELPAKAAVLDGEVVASNADGSPNFARLHVRWARPGAIPLWAFDLLAFNGRDLRQQPLVKRRARLQALLERFGCPEQAPRCPLSLWGVQGLAQDGDCLKIRGQLRGKNNAPHQGRCLVNWGDNGPPLAHPAAWAPS